MLNYIPYTVFIQAGSPVLWLVVSALLSLVTEAKFECLLHAFMCIGSEDGAGSRLLYAGDSTYLMPRSFCAGLHQLPVLLSSFKSLGRAGDSYGGVGKLQVKSCKILSASKSLSP